jgi:hypothetical protein
VKCRVEYSQLRHIRQTDGWCLDAFNVGRIVKRGQVFTDLIASSTLSSILTEQVKVLLHAQPCGDNGDFLDVFEYTYNRVCTVFMIRSMAAS